jgi:hypothetical protein
MALVRTVESPTWRVPVSPKSGLLPCRARSTGLSLLGAKRNLLCRCSRTPNRAYFPLSPPYFMATSSDRVRRQTALFRECDEARRRLRLRFVLELLCRASYFSPFGLPSR